MLNPTEKLAAILEICREHAEEEERGPNRYINSGSYMARIAEAAGYQPPEEIEQPWADGEEVMPRGPGDG